MRVVRALLGFALVAVVLGVGGTAGGTAKLPKPGTPLQVANLVATSSAITSLPAKLLPPLSQVSTDQADAYYSVVSRRCEGVTKCVFGDKSSKELLVLFGDSHAQMWLPAFVPIAQSKGFKVALVWLSGCPAADVSVWDASTHSIDKNCNTFRSTMITNIIKAKPAAVLLADRTSDIPGAGNKLISDAVWQAGLEHTISAFKAAKLKVAVIGDITAFDAKHALPACLAANPNSVQTCSVSNPNPNTHQHFAAEQAAATAESVDYLNPQQWLCTSTCSPIIGNMVAYYDDFHVTATYAEFLELVWEKLLQQDGLLP